MSSKREHYIPALNFRRLTPLYDPLQKWIMREDIFKHRLIAQAAIRDGHQVLDLGCGTGTLTLMVKQLHPNVEVTGMDGDLEVLDIAKAKAKQAGLHVAWDHGLAFELAYPPHSFDWVLSSLMLHHLTRDQKRRTFTEVLRVLRPGGEFHIVDFGPPRSFTMRGMAWIMRHLEDTKDNFDGLLPGFLTESGFLQVAETGQVLTGLGPLSLYRAVKPVPGDKP